MFGYVLCLAIICFDLAVAPNNLPFYVGLLIFGVAGVLACGYETKRIKVICTVALALAVAGTLAEIASGEYIKKSMEKARELPVKTNTQRGGP
jgi:hypothetical protein